MHRDLPALANSRFDLLVIGGGICGAGIARDAALRGLRVAVVDQADFASGTSSRSTKLIHGGFRYLEQGALGLVAESCRERRILQELAPHLVKPQSFLFAVYASDARPLWQVNLGLTLYDWLAAGRNPGRHKRFSAERTLDEEPALSRQGLRGSVRFYDCAEDDARFCLDNIWHAAALGAVCANYCRVTRLTDSAAEVADLLGGASFAIRARWFVNATGPWVGQLADVPLSPTKGVHLVLPRLTRHHGIFFEARRDRRIIFIVPWLDGSLLGSTDTDYAGDPAAVATEPADVDYLLAELRRVMPDGACRASDIIATFAGVRPLLRSTSRATARSREERIVWHRENFVSVAGGKYTTYRAVAEKVVNHLSRAPCRTATTPLPPHRPPPVDELASGVFASDVQYACQQEMAVTLADVMRRRTPLALSRHGDRAMAERVASVMARELGWSEAETHRQVEQYLAGRTRGTL